MLRRKDATAILLRKHAARIERHAEIGGMRHHLDLRRGQAVRRRLVLVLGGASLAAAVPWETELHAGLVSAVELARRNVVAHAVHLVIGEPQRLVLRVEVLADRIAHAPGEDFAVLALAAHAHDAADAGLLVEIELLRRRHIERLSERDVELVVRPNAAGAGGVIVRLLLGRDEIALLHHLERRHVRPLVEELGCREDEHAVLFGDEKETILREADAVWNLECNRRRKFLHLIGDTGLGAVRDRPHLALARAHKRDDALRPNRDVTRIGHESIEINFEPAWQLDLGERFLDRLRFRAGLRDVRHLWRARLLEVAELFEIARRRRWLSENRRGECKRERRDGAETDHSHGVLLASLFGPGRWKKYRTSLRLCPSTI